MINRKTIIIVGLILFLAIVPIQVESSTIKTKKASISLLHETIVIPYSKYAVHGIVKNIGDVNLEFVKIRYNFYDSSDDLLATEFTYTDRDIVAVDEKTTFSVLTDFTIQEWDHYEIKWEAHSVSKTPYRDLIVKSHNVDRTGFSPKIIGEIENIGQSDTTFVKILFAFFESGTFLGVDYTYADPYDIPAGETSVFENYVSDFTESFTDYEMYLDCNQYYVITPTPTTTTTTPTTTTSAIMTKTTSQESETNDSTTIYPILVPLALICIVMISKRRNHNTKK